MMNATRRKILQVAFAGPLWMAWPHVGRNGNLRLVREAEATWMVAAQLALSAISTFTRSDGGMGAMLSAMKELQEENIRLTQQVLVSLADVQKTLAAFPDLLRDTFRESAEYRVREETTDVFNRLTYLERERRDGRFRSQEAADLIEKCVSISRYQSVPHGIGGVGAMCAPVVSTVDARARALLNRTASTPNAIKTFYLPWLTAIRSDRDGALQAQFFQAGTKLQEEIGTFDKALSTPSTQRLQPFLKQALTLDAGAPKIEAVTECVRVRQHVRNERVCAIYVDPGGEPGRPRGKPPCDVLVEKPVYQHGPNLDRALIAENRFVELRNASAANPPGPLLSVEARWKLSSDNAKTCPDVTSPASVGRPEDIPNFVEKSDLKAWDAEFAKLQSSTLAKINELRQQLYAMQSLLASARESENLLLKISV